MEQPFVRLALPIDNYAVVDPTTDARIHTYHFGVANERCSVSRRLRHFRNLSVITVKFITADSTRQCNFTHGMMREAAMPKCFSPSKVKEHECEPITASLRVSVTKFMP